MLNVEKLVIKNYKEYLEEEELKHSEETLKTYISGLYYELLDNIDVECENFSVPSELDSIQAVEYVESEIERIIKKYYDTKKIKRINNLIIKFSKKYNKFQVIAPNKKVLEEFEELLQAEKFAKNIKDFRKKASKIDKINDIDLLCEIYNEKHNLKRNEIGSIEHHKDMSENSIVKIANEHRGTIQLIYGDDKVLIKFLRCLINEN